MRKLLLLLTCLLTLGYSYAATESVTFKSSGYSNAQDIAQFTAGDVTFDLSKGENNNNGPKYYNTGTGIRLYPKNTVTASVPSGYKITEIVMTFPTGSNGCSSPKADVGSISATAGKESATWTGSEQTVVITNGATSGHWRWQSVTVTYESDGTGETRPDAPEISMGENNTVVLIQADADEIRYTVDETDPTETSTLYTAPFPISEKTTVKAIAIKNNVKSSVKTMVVYPNVVANISEFITVAPPTDAKVNTPLTAIYQCGRNLYLTDGTDYILSYNSGNVQAVTDLAAQNGDQISFMTGSYKLQAGLPEIIPSAVGEKSAGTAVEPQELAIEELSNDILNTYVKITGVNIVAAADANNYTATDETGSITIYNTFYNATYYPDAITLPDGTTGNTVPEGEGFTLYGFVSCYNSTLQITPIRFEGGTVMETVATPVFNPVSGTALNAGDEITITCATEGATIYIAFDNETPTTSSQVYDGALVFSENVKINAIAVKEGMLDSDVATASYTLKVAGEETAMFDFTTTGNAASLTESSVEASNDNNATVNVLTDVVFSNGPVALTVNKGSEGTADPKWWSETSNNNIRAYKNNEISVFLIEDGYRIESVTFSQITGSTSWATSWTITPNDGTLSGKVWTAAANSLVNSVEFVPAAASRIAKIEVKYVADENGVQGIDDIVNDNANAPVEYYNLQGIRVNGDNLTPGIYIRRQGTEVTKVYVR